MLQTRRSCSGDARHLITIDDLSDGEIVALLDSAEELGSGGGRMESAPLRERMVASVFFESSTRTSMSFELAAKRLGAEVVSLKASGSSVDKGESLADTIRTIDAYRPSAIVIRHPNVGAPRIAASLTDASIVNAGDGAHQHPTQCLLDMLTIRQTFGRLRGVRVAIVGDILHSRVARSNLMGFRRMGIHVTLVAPPTLMPVGLADGDDGVECSTDIGDIRTADVVYVLRMQRERMRPGDCYVPTLREYAAGWAITEDRLAPGQWVMHPGPMNRGIEIDGRVADGPRSLIARQVASGLFVRMAALRHLLVNRPGPAEHGGRRPRRIFQRTEHQRVEEGVAC